MEEKNIWKAQVQAEALKHASSNFIVIIHIDRDFLTDGEYQYLREDTGISVENLFITKGSDIEWYFTDPRFFQEFDCKPDKNKTIATRDGAISSIKTKSGRTFATIDVVWNSLNDRERCIGKTLLKDIVKANNSKNMPINEAIENIVFANQSTNGPVIAQDLKDFIDKKNV